MNAIEEYMSKIEAMLNKTTDPFVQKYPEVFKELIESVAKENWIKHGEPILYQNQMDEI